MAQPFHLIVNRNAGLQSHKNVLLLRKVLAILIAAAVLAWLMLPPLFASQAAPVLTLEPLTWDSIGLDTSIPSQGPTIFPVGARLCNKGDTVANSVTASFVLTDTVDLTIRGADKIAISALPASECQDVYYQVAIDPDAVTGPAGEYSITASSALTTTSTGARVLTIESLTQTPDIQPGQINGPTLVHRGEIHKFSVRNSSSPVYDQLEQFINFPSDKVQILDVRSSYANPGVITDTLYIDTGQVGGVISTTYTVQIIGTGEFTLTNTIYGYENDPSGFFYNVITDTNADLQLVAQEAITLTQTAQASQTAQAGTQTAAADPTNAAAATATYQANPTNAAAATQTAQANPTNQGNATGTAQAATATFLANPTNAANATATATAATATYLANPTNAAAATATRNAIATLTATVGTPNITITKAISRTEARANDQITFTIQVRNQSSYAVTLSTLTDTYPQYLNYSSATSSPQRGQISNNSSTRTVTISSIGQIAVNETITFSIVMVVNNTATTTTTATNTATITYLSGSTTASKAATSPSFRILASTTLPGTGIMGPPQQQAPLEGPMRLAGLFSLLLALLGIGALAFSRWARRNRPGWADWYLGTGLMLAGVAIVFGLAAWGLRIYSYRDTSIAQLRGDRPLENTTQPGLPNIDQSLEDVWSPDMFLTATPERLPDYPIPTPSAIPTTGPDGEQADSSPINHIRIPAINVDHVVKYVPFDGLTWMIAGLRQEIAWMGETSWPGLGGNTALAGHVTISNGIGPFYELNKLEAGDAIELFTEQKIYVYQVRGQQVVAETDLSSIQPSQGTQLTLITCTGWDENSRFYLKRLVVTADLIETRPLFQQTAYKH